MRRTPNVVSWFVARDVVIEEYTTCCLEVWVEIKVAQSDGYMVEVQVIPENNSRNCTGTSSVKYR
jgi:hypothetical protein